METEVRNYHGNRVKKLPQKQMVAITMEIEVWNRWWNGNKKSPCKQRLNNDHGKSGTNSPWEQRLEVTMETEVKNYHESRRKTPPWRGNHHGGGTTMEAEIRTIHGSSILIKQRFRIYLIPTLDTLAYALSFIQNINFGGGTKKMYPINLKFSLLQTFEGVVTK